jgi:hypothetical protein
VFEDPGGGPGAAGPRGAREVVEIEDIGLGLADEAPPLELLDDDLLDDLDGGVKRAAPGAPELQGHPNYTLMTRLFPHRLREAGKLAAEVAAAPAAAPGEEVEAV